MSVGISLPALTELSPWQDILCRAGSSLQNATNAWRPRVTKWESAFSRVPGHLHHVANGNATLWRYGCAKNAQTCDPSSEKPRCVFKKDCQTCPKENLSANHCFEDFVVQLRCLRFLPTLQHANLCLCRKENKRNKVQKVSMHV